MSKGIKIGKAGLNPTIPVCHYCGKGKNQIMLTGLAGEKWAKKNGHSDGQMPMEVYVEDDIEPCDECKKLGIAVVEVDKDQKLTGNRWLIKEEAVERMISNEESKKKVLEMRVMVVPEEVTRAWGLRND